MLTVLVPCAGAGKRFAEAGYTEPKPLVRVGNVPLVVRAIDPVREALKSIQHRFVFVVLDDDAGRRVATVLTYTYPSCTVIPLTEPTDGAACTCLAARDFIDNANPLLIVNCDQIVAPESVRDLVTTPGDATVLTMHADGTEKWSYVQVGPDSVVERVAEKEVLSDRATCGLYHFEQGATFVRHADMMLGAGDRTNGEFYVAPVLDWMIFAGCDVREVPIERTGGEFFGLGTPEDVEKYLAEYPTS